MGIRADPNFTFFDQVLLNFIFIVDQTDIWLFEASASFSSLGSVNTHGKRHKAKIVNRRVSTHADHVFSRTFARLEQSQGHP